VSTPPGPARATGSYYEAVGGEETFHRLVARFYEAVATDPILRPLYPEEDLGPAEDRLRMFLVQYWGGPNTYSEQRGHPRLRMRHVPFAVGPVQIEAWLRHMLASLDELALPPELDAPMRNYLITAAYSLQNTDELPDTGSQAS
jgi:hemoglobin